MTNEMRDGLLVGAILGFAPGAGMLLSLAIDFIIDLPGRIRRRRFLHAHDLCVDQSDLIRGSLDNFCSVFCEYFCRRINVDRRVSLNIGTVIPPKIFRKQVNPGSDKTWEWFGENR